MLPSISTFVEELHSFWFGQLTDDTVLDRETDPFKLHFQRWYGKNARVDQEIRERFEPTLSLFTGSAEMWTEVERATVDDARASLCITVLLDQLPRNMYRGTARMYAHDDLALAHCYRALVAEQDKRLSLVERMFAYLPLMHAENLTIQRIMEGRFAEITSMAAVVCPYNLPFYEYAMDYARRHREIVERFGRFPHRNELLQRRSTEAEVEALQNEELHF